MGQTAHSVEGQVRTRDNGPLPRDVTVRLEEAEGAFSAQQSLGNDGRFRFDGLEGSMYRLVVTAKAYRTVSQDVELAWEASRIPTIHLVPVVKKRGILLPRRLRPPRTLRPPSRRGKSMKKALVSWKVETSRKRGNIWRRRLPKILATPTPKRR